MECYELVEPHTELFVNHSTSPQDEVIELNREVVLSRSELEDLCCPNTGIGGTDLYSPQHFTRVRINSRTYLKLTQPRVRLTSSVSAIVEQKLLGSPTVQRTSAHSTSSMVTNRRNMVREVIVLGK